MNKIALIGLGNFGTALARNWIEHGLQVKGWTIEEEVYRSIKKTGVNEKYLPGISIKGLAVSMSLEETISDSNLIVLALPSSVANVSPKKTHSDFSSLHGMTMSDCPKLLQSQLYQ